tara:strand:+ start:2897 stop:3679 length:783 start_codon:yes stop_codon:yes gene_type:complete
MLVNKNTDYNFFTEKGYIVKNLFINDTKFSIIAEDLKLKIENYLKKNFDNLKNLGGYKSGNLNFISIKHSKQIIDLLNEKNFKDYFNYLTQDDIKEYDIIYGGNLNLPKSKNQFFHTDGKWSPRMIVINIATSDIKDENGPMEIIDGSHKTETPYWKFILKILFSTKKKIFLKKGEFIIREHQLWHRGTTNNSKDIREMLGIMFIKKKIEPDANKELDENYFSVFSNIFGFSKKEKIKEFIFVKIRVIFFLYKLIISIIK